MRLPAPSFPFFPFLLIFHVDFLPPHSSLLLIFPDSDERYLKLGEQEPSDHLTRRRGRHLGEPAKTASTVSISVDASCYTIVFEDSSGSPSIQELRSGLKKGSEEVRHPAEGHCLCGRWMRSGISSRSMKVRRDSQTCRQQPRLFMPIIQYVLPTKYKALKKLLHFCWEVCPKYDDNGKPKQEMILVVCLTQILARILFR